MFKHKYLKRLTSFCALVILLVTPAVPVLAANNQTKTTKQPEDATQSVTQTYGVEGTLQKGMIVKLDGKDSSKVVALKSDESTKMHGVVVAANDSALTLSGDQTQHMVYVATYGRYPVLVSNQNGSINKGDLVTISALDGIGMKAGDKQEVVLGRAVTAFDGHSNVEGTASLKDSAGQKLQVGLGRISVDLGISHNPLLSSGPAWGIAAYLQDISNGVAGKDVQPIRIYLSIILLMVTTAISGFVLLGGVKSAVVSIGRNPLAKAQIMRSLFQVILSSIIIFVLGLFGVYLLLKL